MRSRLENRPGKRRQSKVESTVGIDDKQLETFCPGVQVQASWIHPSTSSWACSLLKAGLGLVLEMLESRHERSLKGADCVVQRGTECYGYFLASKFAIRTSKVLIQPEFWSLKNKQQKTQNTHATLNKLSVAWRSHFLQDGPFTVASAQRRH